MNVTTPKVVYHGSPGYEFIPILEPRAQTIRDEREGLVIFATPYIAYASCFLTRTDSTWVQHGRFGSGNPFYCVISNEARFRHADKGGTIYTLPGDTFIYDNKYGTGAIEWLSKSSVRPIDATACPSALETMIEYGVQVYFVDSHTYQKILDANDYGYSLLHQLTSENQLRAKQVIPLTQID